MPGAQPVGPKQGLDPGAASWPKHPSLGPMTKHPTKNFKICGATLEPTERDPINRTKWLPRVCLNKAGLKTTHSGYGYCHRHGGSTSNGTQHAQRMIVEEHIEKELAPFRESQLRASELESALASTVGPDADNFGSIRRIDPFDALEELVSLAAGNVSFLTARVRALQARSDMAEEDPDAQPILLNMRLKLMVEIYNQERDRLARTAKMALDAGIDERRLRIEERTATSIFGAIQAALEAVQLDGRQTMIAKQAAAGYLRSLQGVQMIEGRSREVPEEESA